MGNISFKDCVFAVILISGALMPGTLEAAPQDFMRSIGKMYVVISVIAVIFVGLAIYLIYLDRKINKLENRLDDES